MVDDFEKISEYNEAGLQILRLHDKWDKCSSLREAGNLNGYNKILKSIELELSWDAKRLDENKKKNYGYIKQLENLNMKILLYEMKKNAFRYYNCLVEKEKLLREIKER